jgi:hypothetical protein
VSKQQLHARCPAHSHYCCLPRPACELADVLLVLSYLLQQQLQLNLLQLLHFCTGVTKPWQAVQESQHKL